MANDFDTCRLILISRKPKNWASLNFQANNQVNMEQSLTISLFLWNLVLRIYFDCKVIALQVV